MTTKEKVGQVFIWTFSGTSMTPAYSAWLEKYQPGALIAFGRNIKSPAQIAKLNSDLERLSLHKMKAPLFLMVDQEGGTVTRLHTRVPLPSALALGKMADGQFIHKFAMACAQVLRGVGFNFDLAPVLDISNPNRDSFIGNRAFGEDPDTVAEVAVSYAQGVADAGMIPTAKHFPGHGGVVQDSHHMTPSKSANYEELSDKDLVPFEEYAQAEFPKALMMAHLALPNIDPSGVPSTYSKIMIHDYLRGNLQYDGLVITDDLEMSGASIDQDIGERAVKAFLAGNDLLMIAGSNAHQKRAWNAVLAAVESGRISKARLKDSISRILNYKQLLKLGHFAYNAKQNIAAIDVLDDLSREVLKKNFRLSLQGKTAHWPQVHSSTKALVLSSDKHFYDTFNPAFRGHANFYHLTPASLAHVERELNKNYDLIVYYASGAQTARWLAHIPKELRAHIIVVNANHPGEVPEQESFMSVLNINSLNVDCGFSLGEALSGPEFRQPARASEATPESFDEDATATLEY
jgi:beta-N-acetylhexosaminidase